MEFDNNRPIYLQINDFICDRILSGELREEERIQSVREYGSEIGVNPNTIVRCYEKLTDDGIIYNKRGIGYFVAENAKSRIIESRKKEFVEVDIPRIKAKATLLGIDLLEYLEVGKK